MALVIRVRAFEQEELPFPKDEDLSLLDLDATVKEYTVEMEEALESIYPDAKIIILSSSADMVGGHNLVEGTSTSEEADRIGNGVRYVRELARRLSFNEMAVVDE